MTEPRSDLPAGVRPWPALWALCLGFFMILVDATMVSVATPALMRDLDADVNEVMWVTSAYLLAYAVPLLITGRLGDRFGPRNMYLTGLTIFTVSSLWCGLTDDIRQLIVARVIQGLGAALLTPQTMTVITRIFPAVRRGQAMGAWGAVAGVATLTGPLVGGILVDAAGWEWIFFVNVPVGIVGFGLALWLVPALPRRSHSFDWLGVVLSAAALFLIVFAVQEGENADWAGWIWAMMAAGAVVFAAFLFWQSRNPGEPLVPLSLFRDRNFSLANIAITTVGFAVTALAFPFMLYAQNVLGYTPVEAALLTVPMAVLGGVLAPFVGRMADHLHPRWIAGVGLTAFPLGLVWLALVMSPGTPVWQILLPMALLGVGNGFVWSPLSTTATRNLPMAAAGAGSGVYNTTRQFGAVIGSAAIAVAMQAFLAGNGLPAQTGAGPTRLPEELHGAFSTAMAQSMLLPAAVMVIGLIAVQFFARPAHMVRKAAA